MPLDFVSVFGSLNMARSNSMTSAGQCRLAPLIACIQDASKLYDYCVKIMFKLHLALPPDTLTGHRERFLAQFKLLRKFYENTSNMQYFKDLIAIPPLPEVTELEEDLIKAISMYDLKETSDIDSKKNFSETHANVNCLDSEERTGPKTADLLGLDL